MAETTIGLYKNEFAHRADLDLTDEGLDVLTDVPPVLLQRASVAVKNVEVLLE